MFKGDIVEVAADATAKPVILKLQPGISVRVTVLDQADDKPIKGARVRLIWTDTDNNFVTDAKGQVELPALTPETWHVQAMAKDRAAVTRVLNLATGEPASVEFKLPEGGSVEGQVRGEDGRPLVGVGVNVNDWDNGGSQLAYVETDADGRYRLDHIPSGKNLKLESGKLEFIPLTQALRLDATKTRVVKVDVVLKKRPHGGSIKGRVADMKGQSIAGAVLASHGNSSDEVRQTKTDADGKFLLENLFNRQDGHLLVVKAKGFTPRMIDVTPGPANEPAEMTIVMEPGHRIKGRAVNEAGKPLKGIRVYFAEGNRGSGMYFGDSTITDAQGRFEFDSLPPDTPFTFVDENYAQLHHSKLPLDGDKEIAVTLKSPGMIKGRVIDKVTGKPVPRVNVSITFTPDRQPGDPDGGSILTHRTNPGEVFNSPQGQFLLKELMPGMPVQVSVTAPGYRRTVLRRVLAQPASEALPVDIQLTPEDPAKLLAIKGKIVNHQGQPVAGADLRLIAATERPANREDFPFNWQMIETNQVEQMANVLQVSRQTSKQDGSFLFENVPGDADIQLVYWAKGIPQGRMYGFEKMTAKERAEIQVKAIAPARIKGTIDRKVFAEFSSIRITAPNRYWTAKMGADGKSFVIEDLPPGQYDVQVDGPAMRSPANANMIQTRLIGRRQVTVGEGNEERIDFGIADLVPNNDIP